MRTNRWMLLVIAVNGALAVHCGGSKAASTGGAGGGGAPSTGVGGGSVTGSTSTSGPSATGGAVGSGGAGSGTVGTGASTSSGAPCNTGAANDWLPVSNIQYDFPSGFAGQFDLRFWCDFVWDDDQKRILFYEGYKGDHGQIVGSIYANTLYGLTVCDATVHLLHVTDSWQNNGYDSFTTAGTPTEPHPRHTYGGLAYSSKRHAVYIASGACAHDSTCTTPDSWKYDVAQGKWASIPTPQDGAFGGYAGRMAGLPAADSLWYFSPRRDGSEWLNVYELNLDTETWSSKIAYGDNVAGLVDAAADSKRSKFLVWINSGNILYSFDPNSKTLTPVPGVPNGFPTEGALTYISTNDHFFFYSSSSQEVWIYDPAGGSFSKLAHANDPGKRVDRYLVHDPVNDVVVAFNVGGEFWQFKYVP